MRVYVTPVMPLQCFSPFSSFPFFSFVLHRSRPRPCSRHCHRPPPPRPRRPSCFLLHLFLFFHQPLILRYCPSFFRISSYSFSSIHLLLLLFHVVALHFFTLLAPSSSIHVIVLHFSIPPLPHSLPFLTPLLFCLCFPPSHSLFQPFISLFSNTSSFS